MLARECKKNRSIWEFGQFDKFQGENLDISQFHRGRKTEPYFFKVAPFPQIEIWGPVCLMWGSINSPLGGQVVPSSPGSRESLFTLVSKLVSATNGRSWNTGTEVSFGGVGRLDRQSAPHLKIAPNPFSFLIKRKEKEIQEE